MTENETQRRTYKHVISVLLTPNQHRALKNRAKRRGQTMSSYLRALAIDDLELHKMYSLDDDPQITTIEDDDDEDDEG